VFAQIKVGQMFRLKHGADYNVYMKTECNGQLNPNSVLLTSGATYIIDGTKEIDFVHRIELETQG
jgi:hypothetical protein